MSIEEYQKLESILNSWWDSLPEEMQQELREFYDTIVRQSDTLNQEFNMEKDITPSQWSDKTMIINTKVLEDILHKIESKEDLDLLANKIRIILH